MESDLGMPERIVLQTAEHVEKKRCGPGQALSGGRSEVLGRERLAPGAQTRLAAQLARCIQHVVLRLVVYLARTEFDILDRFLDFSFGGGGQVCSRRLHRGAKARDLGGEGWRCHS
ncbi:unnamed protein product, partial [Clonostachys byssicola]